ncbi:uncharacterized protein RCC_05700 [Ramularia collo-cygni]|uniref:Uncharacterized protein n=1 Tax=Ramularia collo-cygni TaxID=112498 RepID=A0A2D3VAZ8_9PEZI|nr:uncharacterized protein RCC_05700 [Ramularia collo-cygni]CZT19844.1 uncharacterized protein RCC_05700 [Ramularia collo-cygni]
MANPLDLQTFKPLEGDSGRTRTFVFRPLAKGKNLSISPHRYQSLPVALSLDLVGFTADNSYVADRLLRETRLEEMVAYWKREHAEIENKSNGAPLVRSSPHRNTSPTRATTSKPLVIEDSLNDPSTCPPKAILESARPVDNSIIPASAKSNAKKTPRSPPTTCNCPLKHRKAPRRVPSSKDGENGGVDGTHLKLKRLPRAKRAQDDDEPPDPEPSEKSQETLAVECSQCTQLKAPPRGKKIAFRKSRGRFMYVPQSAPGDDDAEDTARNDRSQQMDEVDEEIVPQSVKMADPAPSKHAIRRATETPAPEDRPVFRLATKEPEKRPEDVQIERSFAPADVPIPGATATNASVTNQVSGQEPQTVEEAPFTEQPIIPHDGAAPSEMVVDNAPVIEAVREDSRAAAEVIATNHSTASSEQPVPSEEASRDTSASDAIVPNSSAASQVATGTESKKRSSPAPVEERPAKQQRIDVDLTGDDDLVHVKSEVFEDREQSAAKGMSKVEEEAELEADLEDIRLQRIDIRLAREAAEKSRNLRRLRESRSGAAA